MQFRLEDLVFAKVIGYPPWPSKVIRIVSAQKTEVFFFGTGDTCVINRHCDLYDYVTFKDKFATPKNLKNVKFQRAMDQIEWELDSKRIVNDSTIFSDSSPSLESDDSFHDTIIKQDITIESDEMFKEFMLTEFSHKKYIAYEDQLLETTKSIIKCCEIDLDDPNPDELIKLLDSFAGLKVTPFMLIKNGACSQVISQLTCFHKERPEYSVIRKKSEAIAKLFKFILEIPEKENLWKKVCKLNANFKRKVKHLSKEETFKLTNDADIPSNVCKLKGSQKG